MFLSANYALGILRVSAHRSFKLRNFLLVLGGSLAQYIGIRGVFDQNSILSSPIFFPVPKIPAGFVLGFQQFELVFF